jgi:hypothetical protein
MADCMTQKSTTINLGTQCYQTHVRIGQSGGRAPKRQKEKLISFDTCVIRTHAPEGIALAGQRVNHSAKVPVELMIAVINHVM